MFNTIQDPRTQNVFGMLARALVPDAGAAIKADQARLDSNYRIAQTNDVYAQTALRQQELEQEQSFAAAQSALADFLASGADFSDPNARAQFMASVARTKDYMKNGPGFAAGATTYVQPGFANDNDFSRIMLGTGVVGDWGGTPTGFAAKEAGLDRRNDADNETLRFNNAADNTRALESVDKTIAGAFSRAMLGNANRTDMNNADNAAEMDRLKYRTEHPTAPASAGGQGRAPLTVTPQGQAKLNEMLAAALASQYPDASVDPGVVDALSAKVAENYQRTRNAQQAVLDTINGAGLETRTEDGWFSDSTAVGLPKSPDAMTSGPAQPFPDLGVIFVNPQTGEKITRDPQTGGWVGVQ